MRKVWLGLGFILCGLMMAPLQARPLVLGTIADEPREKIRLFSPVADYLARQLAVYDVDRGEVVVARTYEEMAGLLKSGKVDLFLHSSVGALLVQRLSGASFLLRRWKDGVAEYRSVIFVRKDSQINEMKQLVGADIAFEKPFSSAGYLLPASELIEAGIRLVKAPAPNKNAAVLAYDFSNSDKNTVVQVHSRKVAAGAMGNLQFKRLASALAEELKVIHQSEMLPYHLVLLAPNTSLALKQALMQQLMTMHKSPEGQLVLANFEKTTQFDEIPAAALKNLQDLRIEPQVLQ